MPETPTLRKQRQFAGKDSDQIADTLETRWTVVNRLVATLIESVRNGDLEPEDVYPTAHHTIAAMTASLFGFSGSFVDTEVLGSIPVGITPGNGQQTSSFGV